MPYPPLFPMRHCPAWPAIHRLWTSSFQLICPTGVSREDRSALDSCDSCPPDCHPQGWGAVTHQLGPPEAKLFQFDPPRVAVRTLTDMVSLLVSPANAGALPAPPRLLVPWRHWASHPFSWIKSPDRPLAMHIKLRLLSAPISCIRPFTDTSIWKEVILLTGISLTLKTRCPSTTTCCPPTAPSKTCS